MTAMARRLAPVDDMVAGEGTPGARSFTADFTIADFALRIVFGIVFAHNFPKLYHKNAAHYNIDKSCEPRYHYMVSYIDGDAENPMKKNNPEKFPEKPNKTPGHAY